MNEKTNRDDLNSDSLSLQEAIFIADLPYCRALYLGGGWARSGGPKSSNWDHFLRRYFSPSELRRSYARAKSHTQEQLFRCGRREMEYHYLSFWDSHYPAALRAIFDPPPILFYSSPRFLQCRDFLAIVGTRSAIGLCRPVVEALLTRESGLQNGLESRLQSRLENRLQSGLQKGDRIGSESAGKRESDSPKGRSLCIVSGFARGVDRLAHLAAIGRRLTTVAVLGAGLNQIGPRSNFDMVDLARNGDGEIVFVTEFPPYCCGYPAHFPRRNRIIAGLSQAVAVIQAPYKSGALITARFALEEGRDVWVFDHAIFDAIPASNDGGRALLASGAQLIEMPELDRRILRRPRYNKEDRSAAAELWRSRLKGAIWLGGDYYFC